MKRKFTLILTAVLMLVSGFTWGQTRVTQELTFPLSSNPGGWPTANSNDLTNYVYTLDNVDYTFALRNVKCNNGYLMMTQVAALGMPAIEGYKLTKVVAKNSGSCSTAVKVGISDSGTEANYIDGGAIQTWATPSSSYTYNLTSTQANTMYYLYVTNKNAQVTSLTLTYESTGGGGTQTVATPTFSPAGGTYYEAQNVTISCATAGATIYYTTDGNDPTTSSAVYSSPIAVSQTITIKAMGAKSGMNNSSVATATYTIEEAPTVISIAEARALANNEYALVQGVVTFIENTNSGTNVYVQDATAGIDLYLNANTAPSRLALGDMVQAYGKKTVFKGLVELSGINGSEASQFSIISTGNSLPVVEKTIAEINEDAAGSNLLQSTRVKIVDATLGTINTNNNTPITQGENSINIYKVPALDNISEGDNVDVIAVISRYNSVQLRVALASDVTIHETPMQTVATPSITPEGGTYTESQTISISCTTQGALIYYTLDGTDPQISDTHLNGTQYDGPFTINVSTTVKAFAVKEGFQNSEIATAEYTIQTPQNLSFHKLFSHNGVTENGTYMIVDVNGGYALTSANGSSSAPTAVPVTIAGDSIYGNIANELQWKFAVADGGYQIYPINSENIYLYSTNDNNGVRVGTNTNNVWAIDITDPNKPNYHGFKNVALTRYLGVYNNSNWRAYTSIGTNIQNTQIEIFVLGEAPAPTYYTVSVAPGIANGTIRVSPSSAVQGDTITVTVVPDGGYDLTTLTYSYGETTVNIDLETLKFVMPASDVVVNGTFTELDRVATPTFTPAAGTFITEQTVSIACTTQGATIYYTIDGTDPTPNSNVYSQALTVSTTTTVKAIATKSSMNNSNIASAEYTFPSLVTIAEARALSLNEYALVQGVVTFIDGRNVYVQDATAAIDLFLNNNTVPSTLAIGDLVLAYGKRAAYNGLAELSNINGGDSKQFVVVSNENELPLTVKTITEVLEDYQSGANMLQSTRIQIVDATIGAINNSGNTPISQGESTMNIYRMPVVEGLLQNDIVTVTGLVSCYNALQMRVVNADDVTFEHPIYPTLVAEPNSLTGFTYAYGEGPSQIKSFSMSASNLEGPAYIYPSESFQISSANGDLFSPENRIRISGAATFNDIIVYVRLKAGMEVGNYNESLYACSLNADTIYITVSGNVTEAQQVSSDYTRISDISELSNGSKVIFAARFNENADSYYAMKNHISGKIESTLFTSAVMPTGAESLPSTIADNDSIYYWTVAIDGGNYTFTNANGNVLGYSSSTNFDTGGANTAWTMEEGTNIATAMVPEYEGFLVTNANNNGRAIAINNTEFHSFGVYSKSNMTNNNASDYNFCLDLFVTGGGGGGTTPVCATPTFSPAAGTYFEAQEVTLSCTTSGATIYYTLDGTIPTDTSMVYTDTIIVTENTTIKAIAMKEGYENSGIAEAQYVIVLGSTAIFEQDWEGEMNGWTFVTVEGIKPWTIGAHNNNHYAYANGYNGGANEQWCISPAFNLDNYSDVTLTFKNAMNFNGPDLQLFFSNNYDGEHPATATWTELTFEKSTGSFNWVESGVIEFTGFSGTNCYIGFKYISTESSAAAWEVDDIALMGFTSNPVLNVAPATLEGLTYVEGNGPSVQKSFSITGMNLTDDVTVVMNSEFFELSDETGDDFDPVEEFDVEPYNGYIEEVMYVRLAEDLDVGTYSGTITIYSELDSIVVWLSGSVTEPSQGGGWNKISSVSDLINGGQVVIASRYDATVGNGYYAMPANVSGKPEGFLFTSVNEGGVETLPDAIVDDIDTYLWNVTVNDTIITLVNAAGDAIGYNSSTNFSGNVHTDWAITYATAGDNAMVPGHNGFVITNVETPNRGFALNNSHKYGAYSTSNLNNGDYNFYLDLFVLGGSATQTVATPVFSLASGTYYEEIDVAISCATTGAAIYYTLDGTDPTANSTLYTQPIHVDTAMTIKAIGILANYENSSIASANYVIIEGVEILLSQDWEGEMTGWTFVTVEGNKPWNISTYGGNHYAYANGYTDDVDNDQWCISPAFDLSTRTNHNVTLTFRNAMNYSGPELELYFSNNYNGQDPQSAIWVPLTFNMSTGGYQWTESGPISLNAFTGNSCYIGFRYVSTVDEGAAAWEVDDVMITVDMGDDPYLNATPSTLTGFQHYLNAGPSDAQTFVLTGGNLPDSTGMVEISLDNNFFEISLDGSTYHTSVTIPAVGTLAPTTVYVRLNGNEIAQYNGTISIVDVVETTVSLSGEVIEYTGIGESLVENVDVWNRDNEILIENNSSAVLEMVIYNILGQPVMSDNIAKGTNRIAHNLAEGLYIVNLKHNQAMMSTKIVVR